MTRSVLDEALEAKSKLVVAEQELARCRTTSDDATHRLQVQLAGSDHFSFS